MERDAEQQTLWPGDNQVVTRSAKRRDAAPSNASPSRIAHGHREIWASDNLAMLAALDDATVGLAYLDPPFNSGRAYDARVGAPTDEVGSAFDDIWHWDHSAAENLAAIRDVLPRAVADLVASLVSALGPTEMSAYLLMIAPRLAEIHRSLSPIGSLYLHCDPAASHYLKIILDSIFGPEQFRSEIIWKRTHAHSSSRRYGPIHDVLLFYTKSRHFTWNQQYSPYDPSYIEKYFTHHDDGGRYQLITCTAPGARPGTRAHYEWKGVLPPRDRHWAWTYERMVELEAEGQLVHSSKGTPRLKRYVTDGEGVRLQDLWLDINPLGAHSDERTGYETQKPLALLERIIRTSSSPGDMVIDAFCGAGTTAVAAELLGRSWTVSDKSLLAASITLARVRSVSATVPIKLVGFPGSVSTAERLLSNEPMWFSAWTTAMVGTSLDRQRTTPSLAIGARRAASKESITSWVPLGPSPSITSLPLVERRPADHIIVGEADQTDALYAGLRDLHVRAVHRVDLLDMVTPEAQSFGGVKSVLF